MFQKMMESSYLVCNMICMVSVGEWTYHWTIKSRKKIALSLIIYAAAFLCCVILHPSYRILIYFFELLLCSMLSKYKFKDKIFKIIFLFFVVGIPEAMVGTFLDILGGYRIAYELKSVLRIVITYFFFYVITKQKWYKKIFDYLDNTSWVKSILAFFVIVFSQIMVVYGDFVSDKIGSRKMDIIFQIVLAMELCAVVVIILLLLIEGNRKQYYLEQNRLKEEYIRMQKEYYQTIYEKDKEMREFRHDVANQIGLLQMLLERGDVDSAKQHLNSVQQNFSQASFHKKYVGVDTLDAILSMMSQKAFEMGIQIEIMGKIEKQDTFDVYALCTIFSNAIDNAIEACNRINAEKRICVKIASQNQTLCCRFENPATEEMYQAVLVGTTTKSDAENHGYGIKNIRKAVERLNGSMEYEYSNGSITLEICI